MEHYLLLVFGPPKISSKFEKKEYLSLLSNKALHEFVLILKKNKYYTYSSCFSLSLSLSQTETHKEQLYFLQKNCNLMHIVITEKPNKTGLIVVCKIHFEFFYFI